MANYKEESIIESTQEDKISYDGRQGRAKLLIGWLSAMSFHSANNNYNGWFQSLKAIYYLCSPFVSVKDSVKVKDQLIKTKNLLQLYGSKNNISIEVIDYEIDQLTEISLSVFKNQFMQTQEEESSEFNPEDFDGGSD